MPIGCGDGARARIQLLASVFTKLQFIVKLHETVNLLTGLIKNLWHPS